MKRPNRHKLATVTWAVVYPLITALLALLEPLIGNLPLPVRTFLVSAIMVPAMVYSVMPAVTARLKNWMEPQG